MMSGKGTQIPNARIIFGPKSVSRHEKINNLSLKADIKCRDLGAFPVSSNVPFRIWVPFLPPALFPFKIWLPFIYITTQISPRSRAAGFQV